MAVYNHLLFSEIFFQQVRSETADLDNLRATLSTIRGTWQYYLPPPPDWDGIGWAPSRPFSPDDVAQLRANIVEQIFAYLELTYGPCEADERAFFLYADWTQEDRTGLCLVLPFSANIEGRDPETGVIPKGRNYAQQLMRLLREHDLDWGVLTNGRHWRLFHRTELSPTETYLHVDLERIIAADDIGDYIVFHRFFSRPAFARQDSQQRLDLYKQQSDEATEVIEDHLSAHVEEIARQLCQGLVEGCRVEGDDVTSPQGRTETYKNALFLVYRLLFVLYAEARDLLPLDVPTYRDVCLRDLLAEAQQNHERGMRYDDEYAMWTRLQALFALIDQGDPAAGVPAYNGGLFDPGRRPFLTEHRIRNDYLQAALIRLSTMPAKGKSYDQNRKPQPIDYRDLSVRHLGSLYEGLLEYNLFVVEDESRVVRVTKKKTQYVPYSKAGKVRAGETVLQVGDVYFSETAGERKATGSYYTPEDVVDYIVRNTVGAKLAELKAEFYEAQGIERQLADLNDTPPDIPAHRQIQQNLDDQFLDFVRQKVLDLKILDPAMGSGHFLVNATHAVADFVVEVLNETPWENGEIDTDVATWKRQVAERCIFGVDLNELAVELAKLCLWMTTAAKGKPLTFLDHHLRWGNSLAGAWLKDVGVYPGAKKESQQAFTLPLERFQVELDQVLAAYQELYAKSSDDVDDVREKARIFDEEIYPVLECYRELLDLHTGVYFGNGLDEATYAQLGAKVGDSVAWTQLKAEQLDALLTQHDDQCFFHWELEFPEVFTRKQKGFATIIGNPPYVRMELLKPLKPLLSSYTTHTSRADLFIYFYERALCLLCDGGSMSFISSSTYTRTGSGEGLRKLIQRKASIRTFIDFGDLPVFEAVTAYPSVIVLDKRAPRASHMIRALRVKTLDHLSLSEALATEGVWVNQADLDLDGWRFEDHQITKLREKIHSISEPLTALADGQFCMGIKTGLNRAFIIDSATRDSLISSDPRSVEVLKPFLEGRDLKPWRIESRKLYLIYTYHGIDISCYPAIYSYLLPFKPQLENRATASSHEWYELQQPQKAYAPNLEGPKIIWPQLSGEPRFVLDQSGFYVNQKIYFIPLRLPDWHLLGLLNSKLCWFYIIGRCTPKRGGWYELIARYMADLPISKTRDDKIEELAKRISSMTMLGHNMTKIEDMNNELNARVYSLYGLSRDEIQIIEEMVELGE